MGPDLEALFMAGHSYFILQSKWAFQEEQTVRRCLTINSPGLVPVFRGWVTDRKS
jgi:hypothetical protein